MSTNLTRFDNNGLELLIDRSNGAVFATQGMLANICKVKSQQIAQFRGHSDLIKTLPVEDSRGITQESKLYPEELILDCIVKFNPELLKELINAGLRVYLHRLAGYEIKSTAIACGDQLKDIASQKMAEALVKIEEQHSMVEHWRNIHTKQKAIYDKLTTIDLPRVIDEITHNVVMKEDLTKKYEIDLAVQKACFENKIVNELKAKINDALIAKNHAWAEMNNAKDRVELSNSMLNSLRLILGNN